MKRVIAFLRSTLYPVRYYLIGPIIWIVYYALYGSLQPYLIKELIDTAIPSGGAAQVWRLLVIAGYFLLLLLSYEVFYLIYDWCDIQYKPALKKQIALSLTDRLLAQDYSFFQRGFSGNIIAKINDAMTVTPDIIRTVIDNYLTNIMSVIVGMYFLYRVHFGFALALGVWSIVFVIASLGSLNRFKYLSNNSAESASRVIGLLADILTNVLPIKLFTAKAHELDRLSSSLDLYERDFIKRRWFIFKLYVGQSTSYHFYQAICLLFLIYLYGQGKVTAGDFALILTLNIWIVDCMWDMADRMRSLSEQWGMLDQALTELLIPPKITDSEGVFPLKISRGEIRFDKVSFRYDEAPLLFNGLSVTISSKQKVGLVGYSGCGKTTFAYLILRIYPLLAGKISIDGQDIAEVTQQSLHQAIGYNPQDPSLFHQSIEENIRYGKQGASLHEIIAAAKKAHAHQFISAFPNGYKASVGERGMKLSGGQRQRVALARLLLKDAPILILDEATSQLDAETEKFIQDSLEDLMKDKTTLVIAHRLSTLLHLDRILVFDKGTIVQDGSHGDLIKAKGLYRTLWLNQHDGFLPETEKKK